MESSDRSKIRIKYGDIELEFEGSEKFIKLEITSYFNNLIHPTGIPDKKEIPFVSPSHKTSSANKNLQNISVSTSASKLGCKSGPDLVIAAVASLHLGQGKDTFEREEILKEMKSATAYFKKNYANNLFSYLNRLVKSGKLLHISGDTYSLHADTVTELRSKLVN